MRDTPVAYAFACMVIVACMVGMCAPAPNVKTPYFYEDCIDTCLYRLIELEVPQVIYEDADSGPPPTQQEIDDALNRAAECVFRCNQMKDRDPPMFYKYRFRNVRDGDEPAKERGCGCGVVE